MRALKLIAVPTSPFAARLQIQALAKGLDLPTEYPADGSTAAQHAKLNPFARSPILVVGEDVIIESAAIAEFLEDLHPQPSLRGGDPLATARVRAFVRSLDLYLFPVMFKLRALQPDGSQSSAVWEELHHVLDQLEQLMTGPDYVCDDHLTLADCALVPACFFLDMFMVRHQQPDLREDHPALNRWWNMASRHAAVQPVTAQLNKAIRASR